MRKLALFIVMLSLVALVLFEYGRSVRTESADYFQNELERLHFSGTVDVRGESYVFTDGRLQGADLDSAQNYAAMRLAYAAMLARIDPLFGYPAEDTAQLRDAIDDIERSLAKLTDIQEGPRDAAAIRVLYPIYFMRNVADMEDARRAFINLPSETTYRAYRREQLVALRTGARAADSFSATVQEYVGDEQFRIIVFGGQITNESLLNGSLGISKRFDDLRSNYLSLTLCLRGRTAECPAMRETVSTGIPVPHTGEENVREIMGLMGEAYGATFEKADVIAGTGKSVCFANLSGPYYMHFTDDTSSSPIRLKYRKDLYFVKTEGSRGGTLQYMADARNITYSRFEPTTYYYCPDIAYDIRTSLGIIRSAQFAREHGHVAQSNRDNLLSDFVYEDDARAYIDDALSSRDLNPDERRELERISLMIRHGGMLDIIAREIADVLAVDLRFKDENVPFDLSAKNLFRTHSAFTSLFLALDESAHAHMVRAIEAPEKSDRGASRIERYSDLKRRLSRDEIVRIIRASADFEGTL